MAKTTRRTRYESNVPEGYVTSAQARSMLEISARTLSRAVKDKRLRAYTFAIRVSRTTPRAYKLADIKALRTQIRKARMAP